MAHRVGSTRMFWVLVAAILLALTGAETGMAQRQVVRSLVSQTAASNGWAVNYPKERKVFLMADRVWVLYSDGSDAVYRSSVDGLSWSEPTLFGRGGHFGHRFAGWFDGVYFHFTLCTSALGADVFYRRGEPLPDGTINWSAPLERVYDPPGDRNIMYPKIMVDSTGLPWISFMELVYQVPNAPPYDAIVLRPTSRDGTWTMDAGFPFTLVHRHTDGYPDPVGAPLTAGKTLWFYNTTVGDSSVYAARVWDGSAWQDEELVVHPSPIYSFFNLVADGDDVHLVHGAGTIYYQKRTWGAGWSPAFAVDGSASGHTAITLAAPGSAIVTWLDLAQNAVRCRQVTDQTWEPPLTLADESAEGLADPGNGANLNALANSSGRFLNAVTYSTGSAAPYSLKFAALTALPNADDTSVGLEDEAGSAPRQLPLRTQLLASFPNPFNGGTVIPFRLATAEHVRLELHDPLGRRRQVMVDRPLAPRVYRVPWDGRDASGQPLASGTYWYCLRLAGQSQSRALVLVR